MSKGSNRRPGTGYGAGYDGIDWGRKDTQVKVAGDTVFGLDPAKQYRQEVAKDGSISYLEVDAPSNRMPRISGNFRAKINGMDTLLDNGFELIAQPGFDYAIEVVEQPAKTCKNCKFYIKEYSWFECTNKEVVAMAKADYGPSFEPPVDFGCNKWEKNV